MRAARTSRTTLTFTALAQLTAVTTSRVSTASWPVINVFDTDPELALDQAA
jgi:hypothetical protein